jgi:hypothetical protein
MKKKRTIAIFCVILVVFSMLAACANKEAAEIDYLDWTFEDWSRADDEARMACVIAFERYSRGKTGIEMAGEEMDAKPDAEKGALKLMLGVLLSISDGKTVRQIIDEERPR